MAEPMAATPIIALRRLELSVVSHDWPFAAQRRREIGEHFAKLRADKPALWNGRVFLMRGPPDISDGVLRGACFETDFASFTAWKDWGAPDLSVRNFFAQGAMRSSDGAYVLGVMAAHTANAGQIYFPCGTPDPDDVTAAGTVDLDANMRREIAEETGLQPGDFSVAPGWYAALMGPFVSLTRVFDARLDAAALRRQILDHLATEREPELADVRIVRRMADLEPAVLPFTSAFLAHMWR
jgi:8-oxo-dGTP pyrophosphatase MutT (NUDIX family)